MSASGRAQRSSSSSSNVPTVSVESGFGGESFCFGNDRRHGDTLKASRISRAGRRRTFSGAGPNGWGPAFDSSPCGSPGGSSRSRRTGRAAAFIYHDGTGRRRGRPYRSQWPVEHARLFRKTALERSVRRRIRCRAALGAFGGGNRRRVLIGGLVRVHRSQTGSWTPPRRGTLEAPTEDDTPDGRLRRRP